MNFIRKPFTFQQPKKEEPSQNARHCKRVIKRDEQGRIKSEEFIGCSKDEIRSLRNPDSFEQD